MLMQEVASKRVESKRSFCDVENAQIPGIGVAKRPKNDSRVPFAPLSKLEPLKKLQDKQIAGLKEKPKPQEEPHVDYQVSYSMLSSASFYEITPHVIEAEEQGNDDAGDITYFGFDLRKHSRMLRLRESEYQANPAYLKWQPEITAKMRMVLLHWLTEICEEFEYHRDTWNVAVNCVDRFLSCVPKIARGKFQLIGITALLVASKMEEKNLPSTAILEQLCDGACLHDEIIQMEKLMLQKIGWLLMPVSPYIFLRLYLLMLLKLKVNSQDGTGGKIQDHDLTFPKRDFVKMMHIVDIALMDYVSVKYSPSLIAASVLYLVYIPGDSIIFELTNYNKTQLTGCIEWLQPFAGVPMSKSSNLVEHPDYYCLQTSNPNAKAFLENYLA